MSAPKKINLLPKEGFEYTPLGRVVTWALTAGKAIVVITELLVILAFLSRFWLDRDLTNLNQQIKEQAALVHNYKNLETNVRSAQAKITHFTSVTQASPDFAIQAKSILQVVPSSIAINQLIIDKSRIQIIGVAARESAIDQFLRNLETLNLGNVELTNILISSDQEGNIRFTLTITKEK